MPEKAMHNAPMSAASRGRLAIASSAGIPRSVPDPPVSRGPRRAGLRSDRSPWSSDSRLRGRAHEPQAEFLELHSLGRRGCIEHRVAARLGLGEGHDLADVRLAREERRPSIDAECDAAVRWGAEFERVEDRTELVAHPFKGLALEQEAAFQQIAPMDPHGPAAE